MTNSVLNAVVSSSDYDGVYLFIGNSGDVRESSDLFVRTIICDYHTGCGKCPGCKKVNAGVHPDVYYIEKSKKKYSVDDFKDILTDAYQKSFEGGKKVFVILNAEDMDDIIQNKLLKLLEEPPENTVIILGVSNPKALLPTVLSRCTMIRLEQKEVSDVIAFLQKEHGLNLSDAGVIAKSADGDRDFALELLESDYNAIRNDVFNISCRLINARTKAYNAYLKKILEYSDYLDCVFLAFNKIFSDMIMVKNDICDDLCNTDFLTYMRSSVINCPFAKIINVYSIIEEANDKYKRCSTINKKLLIEQMLIEILEKAV